MAITNKYVSTAGAGTHDGSSEANALTFAEMVTAINAGGTAGNRYNIKADATYSFSADVTISGSGTSTSPVIIRGYSSVIGDGYLGRTNDNGAIITTNMPVLSVASTFRVNVSGTFILTEALNISGTRDGTLWSSAADNVFTRCNIVNASTGSTARCWAGLSRAQLINSDARLTGASGGLVAVDIGAANCVAIGNRIRGGTAMCLSAISTSCAVGNLLYRGTVGISMSNVNGIPLICGNTIVNNSGDGIDIITGTTGLQRVVNNLISDNGGYGIDGVSAANAIMAAYNRLDRNTAGATNLATDWLASTSYGHNLTSVTQAQEYVDAATDDYRLQSTSPALGAGWFPYMDIGALQRVAAAAGGGPVIGSAIVRTA